MGRGGSLIVLRMQQLKRSAQYAALKWPSESLNSFITATGSRPARLTASAQAFCSGSAAFFHSATCAGVIESLPNIKVPSIVIVGSNDTPFLAASDYMAAKIPGCKKAVIPNAGHAANIDQPQAFNEAVLGFLGGLPV